MLKSQDCVILMKLIANPNENWSQRELAQLLFISPAEINKSIKRLVYANLLRQDESNIPNLMPVYPAAKEFLVHGIKYVFPVKLGEYTPGIATAVGAPIFKDKIVLGNDPIPVWPYGKGNIKGLTLEPLYSTVPRSIKENPDQAFYDLLALVDAIRQGRARERQIAADILKKRINHART